MACRKEKLDLRTILNFYDAWLRSETIKQVARALGRRVPIIEDWLRRPEIKLAREVADQHKGNREDLADYICGHLSAEAKAVYEELEFWKESDSPREKVDALLAGHGKEMRQQLFVHALLRTNFDMSSACHMVGITRQMLCNWRKERNFLRLIEEVHWHKKNFFEKSLLQLVEAGHPAAVLFVNRTVNADRGYGEKLEVKGSLDAGSFSLDDLDLDLETRKKILDAIRRKKELEQPKQLNSPPPSQQPPIDV